MAFKLIYSNEQTDIDQTPTINQLAPIPHNNVLVVENTNTNNQTPTINLLSGRIYKTDVVAKGIEYKIGDSLYINNGQLTNKSNGKSVGKISLLEEDGLSFVCL